MFDQVLNTHLYAATKGVVNWKTKTWQIFISLANFVVLPGHISLQIIVFGKERLRNLLNASQRRVNKNSLTWWYVLKMSWRRLEDVLKTSWRRLEDVWLTRIYSSSSRRLEDVLKTSFEDEDERLGFNEIYLVNVSPYDKQELIRIRF